MAGGRRNGNGDGRGGSVSGNDRLFGDILIFLGVGSALYLSGGWTLLLWGTTITGALVYFIRVVLAIRER